MSRLGFTLIMLAIVVIALSLMWIGWRARTARGSAVATAGGAPTGAQTGAFTAVSYVSTTPVGAPLDRVAVPGLVYRGPCEIRTYTDGVAVQVRGEHPVYIGAGQLRGSGSARARVGKAVEAGGLALMRWDSGDQHLESSFRFEDMNDHEAFRRAIDRVSGTVQEEDR